MQITSLKSLAYASLALILLGPVGCSGGKPGPKMYDVSGTVKFEDGTPLTDGTIQFVADDGKSNPASAEIKNGKFQTKMTEGKKKVGVSQIKVVGTEKLHVPTADPGQGPTIEIKEEQVDREYNERSKLTVEVTPNGQNVFDLPVKRADPKKRPLSQPY